MNPGIAYTGGRYMPVQDAAIPILDWGFLHSDAVYDVVHVWDGAFFRLDDHLARFDRSMRKMALDAGHDAAEIAQILHRCVATSGLRQAYVEMLCTRGVPRPGSRDPRDCRNAFHAFAIPFVWVLPRERFQNGLAAVFGSQRRIPAAAVDPTIKNYHWLDFTRSLLRGYEQGAETVILLDDAHHVTEGPGFNVFAVRDNTLVTPARGVLEGITRRTVLECAQRSGLRTEVRDLSRAELLAADEIFGSSTAGGILPICHLDGRSVGAGSAGDVTQMLSRAYWRLHEDPAYRQAVVY